MKTLAIIIGVLLLYFLIHWGLSRWSQSVIVASGFPSGGFYYIPVSPVYMANHQELGACNDILKTAFYPCEWLDKKLLNGPDYAYAPKLGMSDK